MCSYFWGQNFLQPEIRVQYEVTYQPNKKDKNLVLKEKFVSIIGKEEAIFKPLQLYIADSILKHNNKKINIAIDYWDLYLNTIISVKNDKIVHSDLLEKTLFSYQEKNKDFNWKITDTIKEISGVQCKIATLEKYGRTWTACYSDEYAFPFGPYKFNGLPGLILEVFDKEKEYHFRFYRIKKYTANYFEDRFSVSKEIPKYKFYELRSNALLNINRQSFLKIKDLPPAILKEMNNEAKYRMENENLLEKE